MKKILATVMGLFVFVSVFGLVNTAEAVSVKGYYKSNGTYVKPYVRSAPNALKYDNYSYKPSQGLYNSSYYAPTKNYSSSYYTPSYYTQSDYYSGLKTYCSKYSYSYNC